MLDRSVSRCRMNNRARYHRVMDPMKITAACDNGKHAVCKCELPGQNKLMAGVLMDIDPYTHEMVIVGWCECECHDHHRSFRH